MDHRGPGWHVTAADALDAEGYERLRKRVAGLPDITRQVVTLRKVYGLSMEEIASRLDLTPEQVAEHVGAAVIACADFGEIADA